MRVHLLSSLRWGRLKRFPSPRQHQAPPRRGLFMPLTITFISLKKAGRCVQCQECHAPKKGGVVRSMRTMRSPKKEIRRSAEAIPPEIWRHGCGEVLRRFCGAFCGKLLKTKTGQDEKHALTCSNAVVPPAGFEPAISTLKGWRPWPLDDGDSGKEYSRLFCRRVYRWQTGKPPHRSWLSIPIFEHLNL